MIADQSRTDEASRHALDSISAVAVIGGGIAGIQASLDLAARGIKVYLIEKTPSIGGRMAQLDKTFPTMDCSICILGPKMIECMRHPNIELLTCSEVEGVAGQAGDFRVTVTKRPRYVVGDKCTGCGLCIEKCPVKVPNEFDMAMGTRKAIYVPFPQAVPLMATIDSSSCTHFKTGKCGLCEKTCGSGAIDFKQEPVKMALDVSAIIVATGLDLFNPSVISEFGYGRSKNVVTSLEFERLVTASGPTGGRVVRPSDGKGAKRIAFIQCVGSRSHARGFPYCSSVCCMYATKEAILVREHDPESEVHIFYIDQRVFGKGFQDFINRAREKWGVKYVRGRPGDIVEDPRTNDLVIRYELTERRELAELKVDLVVLCPALVPSGGNEYLGGRLGIGLDEYGFFKASDPMLAPLDTDVPGIFICGYCHAPKDIPESVVQASGAAARAATVIATKSMRGAGGTGG